MPPLTYSSLVNIFQKENCKFSETQESFNNKYTITSQISRLKVDFIASCGHPNSVIITNFISKKSGILCKDCIKNKIKTTLKDYQCENNLNASKGHIQENDVYNLLKPLLNENFEVKKTNIHYK